MPSLDKRNEELNQKISTTDLPSAVAILISDAKKAKRRVRLLGLSIILDLLLTVGLFYTSAQTHQIATQAESNRSALARSCETSNEARANNAVLWDYLLAQQPSKPFTDNERQFRGEFVKLKNKTFSPRDCSTIK